MILDDLESGGWLGKIDEKAREEGWYEYNRQLLMKNRSKAQYLLFMLHWKIGAYLKALFPSRKTLAIRYPCMQKKRDCDSFCMGASTDIPRKPSGEKGSADDLYHNG